MTEKFLGKITRAEFGFGGYQDGELGLSLTFEGSGYGVRTFIGAIGWEWTKDCKWTESDRVEKLGISVLELGAILSKAKKTKVSQLLNIPVEVTFKDSVLESWRVLEEVI